MRLVLSLARSFKLSVVQWYEFPEVSLQSSLDHCWALGTEERVSWPLPESGRKERQCVVGGETSEGLFHERQETPGAISHA